ncbi:MAG: division/cell wall cluster transcriptional repressor MraZ [Fibrobacterota bacterium]
MVNRFIGTYEYSVDAKGRVNIPAKFRKTIESDGSPTLYIRKAPNNALWVYPEDVWEKEARKLEQLPKTPKNLRYYSMVYRSMTDSTVDSQGRITISPKQRRHAQIDKKVALVGMGNFIEIVHPDVIEDDNEDFDDLFFSAVEAESHE